MKYTDVDKVRKVINASDEVERIRSLNRAKINNAMNGAPPLSASEASKTNLRVNCNFGEMPRFAAQARRQYSNAFLKPGNFFTVKIPAAPPEVKMRYEMLITQAINRPMKRSRKYFHLKQNQFASVVAHGIGPQVWEKSEAWLPSFVAIEDFRVPTDTQTSLENLPHFAIRKNYTPMELADKAYKGTRDKGWNTKIVSALLDKYTDDLGNTVDQNWSSAPEKMYELLKQNGGFYRSDAVPTIPLWHFYFEDEGQWYCRVVPTDDCKGGNDFTDFVYSSDKAYADDLSEFVHIQFGDLNAKAPFLWHSVRSLGFLLMDSSFFSNLLQCRFLQHVFESMNAWFRASDPAGRQRAMKLEMFDRAVIPEGISVVPQTERHQIPADLVQAAQAQMRQLMAEASASYTQQIDNGTQKEQTAYETSVKLSQVNAMLGAILSIAFYQEKFAYYEIARRFCIVNSSDSDVRKFQRKMKEAGVPSQFLDVDLWDIEPEVPLGAGNPTMEQAMAQQLLSVRNLHSPTAQQKILHIYDEAITGDPQLAQDLAPLEEKKNVTDAERDAETVFSTLMLGVPVRQKEGLNPIEQIETLIGLMAGVVSRIEQTGNMAQAWEVAGLNASAQYVDALIQQLAQDPNEKQRVKGYSDSLGKLMNTVKGFEQRLAEANVKESVSINYKDAPPDIQRQMEQAAGFQPSQDPGSAVDAKTQKAVHGMAIKEAQSKQKEQHQDIAFSKDQMRKDAETIAEIGRQTALHVTKPEPPANGA